MSMEENKTLIRRCLEAWSEWESALLEELHAIDVEWHVADLTLQGIDAVKQMHGVQRSSYSYRHFDIEVLIVEGDWVVARLLFHGTRTTGEQEVKHGIQIYRVGDGKVQDLWEVWQDDKPFNHHGTQ
jgi:predicted ester cyclase